MVQLKLACLVMFDGVADLWQLEQERPPQHSGVAKYFGDRRYTGHTQMAATVNVCWLTAL